MENIPLVSIIMSVYNGEKYLKDAIESVLNQSYKNIEFIIINDGSKDNSLKIITSYVDSRIVIVDRENKGLIYSLNEGFRIANGKYIARQDADDISDVDRIKKQVQYLEEHAEIYLLGTSAEVIDEDGNVTGKIKHPTDINEKLFFRFNPFVHGSIMLRSYILHEFQNWYDKDMLYIEDYDFFWRICCAYKCSNLTEFLYQWRKHEENISITRVEVQVQNKYLRRLLYAKKINSMNIDELNSQEKKEMAGMVLNNKGHYLLKKNDREVLLTYGKSFMLYPCFKTLVFFILSVIYPKLLKRLIS